MTSSLPSPSRGPQRCSHTWSSISRRNRPRFSRMPCVGYHNATAPQLLRCSCCAVRVTVHTVLMPSCRVAFTGMTHGEVHRTRKTAAATAIPDAENHIHRFSVRCPELTRVSKWPHRSRSSDIGMRIRPCGLQRFCRRRRKQIIMEAKRMPS